MGYAVTYDGKKFRAVEEDALGKRGRLAGAEGEARYASEKAAAERAGRLNRGKTDFLTLSSGKDAFEIRKCAGCGRWFKYGRAEHAAIVRKGLAAPSRCPGCRARRAAKDEAKARDRKLSARDRRMAAGDGEA